MPNTIRSKWKWEITNWRWWLVFHLTIAVAVLCGPMLSGHTIIWWLAIAALSLLMLIALIVYAPRKHYKKNPMSRRVSMVIIVSGPLLILTYVYARLLYTAGLAQNELERLCAIDAGVTINRTVDAAGYFYGYSSCDSCWKEIIKNDYEFIEFCGTKNYNADGTTEPPCRRITKADKNNPDCDADITANMERYSSHRPYAKFLQEHCFVTTKLEKPTAEAGFFFESTRWQFDNYYRSIFVRQQATIKDLGTHEVLAEFVDYYTVKIPDSSARSTTSCQVPKGYSSYAENLIPNVILPTGKRRDEQ